MAALLSSAQLHLIRPPGTAKVEMFTHNAQPRVWCTPVPPGISDPAHRWRAADLGQCGRMKAWTQKHSRHIRFEETQEAQQTQGNTRYWVGHELLWKTLEFKHHMTKNKEMHNMPTLNNLNFILIYYSVNLLMLLELLHICVRLSVQQSSVFPLSHSVLLPSPTPHPSLSLSFTLCPLSSVPTAPCILTSHPLDAPNYQRCWCSNLTRDAKHQVSLKQTLNPETLHWSRSVTAVKHSMQRPQRDGPGNWCYPKNCDGAEKWADGASQLLMNYRA